MRILVQNWINANNGDIGTWDDFDAYVFENHIGPNNVHYVDQVSSLRTNGLALATAAGIASVIPGGVVGGGIVGVTGVALVTGAVLYLIFGGKS
jgi:hypothetical protein